MEFWFFPASKFMRIPLGKELPSYHTLRNNGDLVKWKMNFDDVLSGKYISDTAAVSHRWGAEGHFDPDGSKMLKLQIMLQNNPSIEYVWIDWLCAPQLRGGRRTDAEEVEFRLILENVLPFIFLGCTVFILYDRIYNQRFWPNVECWIATKMPTEAGLVPASEERLRIQVNDIH